MRVLSVTVLAALIASASGLVQRSGPVAVSRNAKSSSLRMEYIPDGLSKEQWRKMKEKEKAKKVGKFDGTSGMKFRSRSFEDFQKGREAGTLKYNMPMEFAKQKLARGEIKPEDIPYMQRPGGMPDGSDLKKKKGFKLPWQK